MSEGEEASPQMEVAVVDDKQVEVVVKEQDGGGNVNRGSWGHKAEFILASIGLAVGLGNVWRFPYLCQKNGGGAFLIPYFTMMIIEGAPLFFIEYAVGQRFRRSAVGCWKEIHPALLGVGISCMVISALLCTYYIVVIAWSFFYLFSSFTSVLPWRLEDCPGYNMEFKNISRLCALDNNNMTSLYCQLKKNYSDCCVHDPQLYYFYRKALQVSPSIEDGGSGISGYLVGCLVLAWVLCYICVLRGTKSSGKAVYFTATFPYVILVILFIFGLTLEGAGNGVRQLFKADWEKLKEPKIWMDAAVQMFFTLSVGFGALVSFASYMPVKNNCIADAYAVVLINCGTSIFAGVVVFSILGHREHVTGIPVTEVGGGLGLAFMTFCDAFLQMPISPLWSSLFFIMLILLGIDSEFGSLEGMIAPFYDMKWVTMRKEYFTAILAIIMLVLGLALVSSPGFYAFQIFDSYSVTLPLLVVGFFQSVAIAWVYGNDRFSDDIEYMTGKRPFILWQLCWKYVSPAAILVIFIASAVNMGSQEPSYQVYVGCSQQKEPFSPISNGTDTSTMMTPYPGWALFFGVLFTLITILPIIISVLYNLFTHPRDWARGFRTRFSSLADYLPDPSLLDKSRRRTMEQVEKDLREEGVLEMKEVAGVENNAMDQ